MVDQLLETGEVRHPFLGIQPAPVTPQIAERFDLPVDRGTLVLSVVPEGPADEAGLESGDIITEVDKKAIDSVEDFLAALRGRAPGDVVDLTVIRDDDEQSIEVRLGERPG